MTSSRFLLLNFAAMACGVSGLQMDNTNNGENYLTSFVQVQGKKNKNKNKGKSESKKVGSQPTPKAPKSNPTPESSSAALISTSPHAPAASAPSVAGVLAPVDNLLGPDDFTAVYADQPIPTNAPPGLNNVGVNCFLNSVLQVFINTPKLRQFFATSRHQEICDKHQSRDDFSATNPHQKCSMCNMIDLVSSMDQLHKQNNDRGGRGVAQDSNEFLRQAHHMFGRKELWTSILGARGMVWEQQMQDSGEFFKFLIESLAKDDRAALTSHRDKLRDSVPANLLPPVVAFPGASFDQPILQVESPLSHLMGGSTSTTKVCANNSCPHKPAVRLEPRFDDGVYVSTTTLDNTRNFTNLRECLDQEFREEEVEMNCPKCSKRATQALPAYLASARCSDKFFKREAIQTLGDVFTITLRRFGFDRATSEPSKNQHKVDIPETLDMSTYMADAAAAAGKYNYELVGAVHHRGASVNSGHYYSFVKQAQGQWWKVDDFRTRKANMREEYNDAFGMKKREYVSDENAYILVYQKIKPDDVVVCASDIAAPVDDSCYESAEVENHETLHYFMIKETGEIEGLTDAEVAYHFDDIRPVSESELALYHSRFTSAAGTSSSPSFTLELKDPIQKWSWLSYKWIYPLEVTYPDGEKVIGNFSWAELMEFAKADGRSNKNALPWATWFVSRKGTLRTWLQGLSPADKQELLQRVEHSNI